MSTQTTPICYSPLPKEREQIIEAFFGSKIRPPFHVTPALNVFFRSYEAETNKLLLFQEKYDDTRWPHPVHFHTQIVEIVTLLRNGISSYNLDEARRQVRRQLAYSNQSTFKAEDEAIQLALRLWLMMNFRPERDRGLAQGRPCLAWDESSTLLTAVMSYFPESVVKLSPRQKRMAPKFKMVNLVNMCQLKLKWTSSLEDHLRLDHEHNSVWVFGCRQFLELALKTQSSGSPTTFPIAPKLLEETIETLNLLFPMWHRSTQELLTQQGWVFDTWPKVHARSSLDLNDYSYWRDRLLELYEDVYLAPPISWGQLWHDRRDRQRFWTFWLAFAILFLTVLSTVATILQTIWTIKG